MCVVEVSIRGLVSDGWVGGHGTCFQRDGRREMEKLSAMGECPPSGRDVVPCWKEWASQYRVLKEMRWL